MFSKKVQQSTLLHRSFERFWVEKNQIITKSNYRFIFKTIIYFPHRKKLFLK
jgi:hypothetical protein